MAQSTIVTLTETIGVIETQMEVLGVEPPALEVLGADATLELLEVAAQGPVGPQGPQGVQGPAGANGANGGGSAYTYSFAQAVPSATWTITHNMNKYPSVTIIDSAGDTVFGPITYTNTNVLVLTFSAAFSGTAFLN